MRFNQFNIKKLNLNVNAYEMLNVCNKSNKKNNLNNTRVPWDSYDS